MSIVFPAEYYLRRETSHIKKEMCLLEEQTALIYKCPLYMFLDEKSDYFCKNDSGESILFKKNLDIMKNIYKKNIVSLITLLRDAGVKIIFNFYQPKDFFNLTPPVSENRHSFGDFYKNISVEMPDNISELLDIHAEDCIISDASQLEPLIFDLKISNLLFCGFESNFGMFYLPGGIMSFCRKTKNFILDDCVAAMERTDTLNSQELKNNSIDIMMLALRAYKASGKDIEQNIKKEILI